MNKNNKTKKIKTICKRDFIVGIENGQTVEILTEDHTSHYNKNENILEEKHRKWSDDQNKYTLDLISYTYNKKGKLTEKYEKRGYSQCPLISDYIYKTVYFYDDEGKLTEHITYDREENPQKKYSYKYDELETTVTVYEYHTLENKEVKEIIHNETSSKYNEKNMLIEMVYHWGNFASKKIIKYDDKNDEIKSIHHTGSFDEKETYKYEYNEHGEIISKYEEYFKDDILMGTEITKYNNGKIVEIISEKYDKNTKSEYTYDKYGNVIKYTRYINGIPVSVQRYEIEYYN